MINPVARVHEGNESERAQQNEKQPDEVEVVTVESDAEWDTGMMIDELAKENLEQRAGTGQAVQSRSANRRATPVAMGVPTHMDVQGEDDEKEMERCWT